MSCHVSATLDKGVILDIQAKGNRTFRWQSKVIKVEGHRTFLWQSKVIEVEGQGKTR